MQKIDVEHVGLQTRQAGLARALKPAAAGVLRIDLADQHDLLAKAGERVAEEAFRHPVAVHLGRVDHLQAKFDACPQGFDFSLSLRRDFAHSPCPLTNEGDGTEIGEVQRSHAV